LDRAKTKSFPGYQNIVTFKDLQKVVQSLLTTLRTTIPNEYKQDKQETLFDDVLDAFRLSLQFYKRAKEQLNDFLNLLSSPVFIIV
jgi:hypothetical protein